MQPNYDSNQSVSEGARAEDVQYTFVTRTRKVHIQYLTRAGPSLRLFLILDYQGYNFAQGDHMVKSYMQGNVQLDKRGLILLYRLNAGMHYVQLK